MTRAVPQFSYFNLQCIKSESCGPQKDKLVSRKRRISKLPLHNSSLKKGTRGSCASADFSLLNFFSYRNGVPVRPDGRNILTSSDGSLILNNVKPSDEGTYTCNAYTGIYSVSATAEVRVIKDTQQGEK